MERVIISKEYIKPFSPTPNHLKIHNFSLFDQIVPPIYVPLVQYFPGSRNASKNADFVSQTTQILKRSLSETLTRFYPLAGRIKDKLSIDCNDEGTLFVTTRIKGNLSDFLEKPEPVKCRDHIACELSWAEPGPGSYVATIQVNLFNCGGIAIGSLFLHKVTDGATIGTFMKAWASNTRCCLENEGPDFISQSLFPQNETMHRETHLFSAMRQYFKIGKTVMRRYVFDSMAISTLRSRMTSGGLQFRPSRVETVSALLWKCFMVACLENKSDESTNSVSLVTHGVNMRRKANPTLPEHSFGNYVWLVPASCENNVDMELEPLVHKVRSAISKVDSEFVGKMKGEGGFTGYLENLEESLNEFPKNADYLAISSWCNFGLYDVDFGWGRPVWTTKCDAGHDTDWPFINVVWLMDTRERDGIEAWVTINEEYIQAFDNNEELKALALVDPSPLLDEEFDDYQVQEIQTVDYMLPSSMDVQRSINQSAVLINGVS